MSQLKKNKKTKSPNNLNNVNLFGLPILICLFICVLLYCLSFFIERSFEKIMRKQNINELNFVVNSIERELTYSYNKNNAEFLQNLLLILADHHRLFVYIIDGNDKVVYRTRGPNLSLAQSEIHLKNILEQHSSELWENKNFSYRILASKLVLQDNEFTTLVAVDRNEQLSFINRLHEGLIILIGSACLLVLIGTIITIYVMQRPINRLTKKIEMVNLKNLHYRIPDSLVPNRYIRLIKAFNNMLHRIEDVVKRQHNFTADIAHEMRTPITNLTTQTQIVLNSARTTAEYREILYSNLEEYEKMSQMISDMLFIAQADNRELIPNLTTINLKDLILHLCDYFEPLSDEKNITYKLDGNCDNIQGDKIMLSRAISNILSNAIRYTPQYGQIKIQLTQLSPKKVRIIIENPGPRIDSEDLPHLFDRFFRIDKSRKRNDTYSSSGTGIGLAIVKSIVETHKGSVEAKSNDDSTCFIIYLPTQLSA